MFSAGTWLSTHQPSHKTFLLLQQGMGRMATAREGSLRAGFYRKSGGQQVKEHPQRPRGFCCAPLSTSSSAPLARQVLDVLIHPRELWLPPEKKIFSHSCFGEMLDQGLGFVYVAVTNVKILEWVGLDGTSKCISFQPCRGQRHLP